MRSGLSDFKGMQDLELQQKAIEAGAEYIKAMFPSLEGDLDLLGKHMVQNAVAAGYLKGYKQAREDHGDSDRDTEKKSY